MTIGQQVSATLLSKRFQLNRVFVDDIIKAILPEEVLGDGAPTGFAVTGHIAHMNLQAEYLPYKHIIGQIILEVCGTFHLT